MSHVHSHHKSVLKRALLLIAAFMLVEIAGGLLTNSLALLSDAGHMLSDAIALALSLAAFHWSERPTTLKNTFGYRRGEIIAAALNGLTLAAIVLWIVIEAIGRLLHPPEVASIGMLAVAVIGLAVNILIAVWMHRGSDIHHNLNMKSAYLHVLGDLRVRDAERIVQQLAHELAQHGIQHSTIQTESEAHGHSDSLVCACEAEDAHGHHH